jgi:hypothetical protein
MMELIDLTDLVLRSDECQGGSAGAGAQEQIPVIQNAHKQNGPSKAPRGPHAGPRTGKRAAPRVACAKCVCPRGRNFRAHDGMPRARPQGGVAE